VNRSDWYADDVGFLASLGLEPGQGELLFTDVAESHWAADQIRTASNK